jgi:hypothetical protein
MLYGQLKEHPEVCMSTIKETNYFLDQYHRGLGWYQGFFRSCGGAKAIGEISNRYYLAPEVPARIAETLPNVKIMTVLRNPYDHIRSVYMYRIREGTIGADTTLDELLGRDTELITMHYYGEWLNRFLGCFPAENVLIAFYDDLEWDPGEFIRSIFRFIGVDDSIWAESVYKKINPSVVPRYAWLNSKAFHMADRLRRWQLYSVLGWAKRSSMVREILFRSTKVSINQVVFSKPTYEMLVEHFTPHIREVERITGRDLQAWCSSDG